MFRGSRFRLAPTLDQEEKFREFAGACRFVYNLALEQREREWTYWRDSGTPLNYAMQSRQLTDLRKEVDWLDAVPRVCLEQSLRDLDAAYKKFFDEGRGYPRHHAKGVNDAFRYQGRDVSLRMLNGKWSAVKLRGIGWVKFRDTRPISGRIASVTIRASATGWHVAFGMEIEAIAPPPRPGSVGIDRGVANTLALSTGEMLRVPNLAAIDRQHRRAHRISSRRQKGSARRRAAQRRVARLAARRARIRRDWQHKVTTGIARRFGTVVMEDLNVVNMTAGGRGKRGLNRSILNQGWSDIARLLKYKLEERGGTLVLVNPAYSSQTCSACGTVDKNSRESQSVFRCRHCGFEGHADHNAALVLLRRNTPVMDVEGLDFEPVEASTRSGLMPVEDLAA